MVTLATANRSALVLMSHTAMAAAELWHEFVFGDGSKNESNRMACPHSAYANKSWVGSQNKATFKKILIEPMSIDGVESIDLIKDFMSLGKEISPPSFES